MLFQEMMRLCAVACLLVLLGSVNSKPRTYLVETKDGQRGGRQEFGSDYMDEDLNKEELYDEGAYEGDDYGLPPSSTEPIITFAPTTGPSSVRTGNRVRLPTLPGLTIVHPDIVTADPVPHVCLATPWLC